MHKIFQARLQQYMNRKLPDNQAGFRKGRGTRDQVANISAGSLKKQENSRKTPTSALLTMPKSLTMWITINCGKFFKRWDTRPLYLPPEKLDTGQEATVRTRHGTIDWFQIGKGVHQGCILSPRLFNFNAEYIM